MHLLLATLLLAGPSALAQAPAAAPASAAAPAPAPAAAPASAAAPAPADAAAAPADAAPAADADAAIRRALDLPFAARDLRAQGIPDADVSATLTAMKGAGLPAAEAAQAVEAGIEGVAANGRIDNFGAFVQAQVTAGLRGAALADAIKAEHLANGKGKSGDPKPNDPQQGAPAEGAAAPAPTGDKNEQGGAK